MNKENLPDDGKKVKNKSFKIVFLNVGKQSEVLSRNSCQDFEQKGNAEFTSFVKGFLFGEL